VLPGVRRPRETSTEYLVANIGSTSFKFRLFEMPSERVLAKGGVERIGSEVVCMRLLSATQRRRRNGVLPRAVPPPSGSWDPRS